MAAGSTAPEKRPELSRGGGMKWKWAVKVEELTRPSEQGESSAAGCAVDMTRAAWTREDSPLGSQEQLFRPDLPLISKAQEPMELV